MRTRRRGRPIGAAAVLLAGALLLAGCGGDDTAAAGGHGAAAEAKSDAKTGAGRPGGGAHASPKPKPKPTRDPRPTSIVAMGDSEISGEGTGRYTKATDNRKNHCHRSPLSLIHRTGIRADKVYDLSCSGADSADLRTAGRPQYSGQPPQGASLAKAARKTRVKLVVVATGANDSMHFSDVLGDCVQRRLTMRGPCERKYGPGWNARVARTEPAVAGALRGIRSVMAKAGYRAGSYRLLLVGYPSPLGASDAGAAARCMVYPQDARWARTKAVPALDAGLRRAARAAGADFVDAGRLFAGHEACTGKPWVRGMTLSLSLGPNSSGGPAQGSYHPNASGHKALGRCVGDFVASAAADGSCTVARGRVVVSAR